MCVLYSHHGRRPSLCYPHPTSCCPERLYIRRVGFLQQVSALYASPSSRSFRDFTLQQPAFACRCFSVAEIAAAAAFCSGDRPPDDALHTNAETPFKFRPKPLSILGPRTAAFPLPSNQTCPPSRTELALTRFPQAVNDKLRVIRCVPSASLPFPRPCPSHTLLFPSLAPAPHTRFSSLPLPLPLTHASLPFPRPCPSHTLRSSATATRAPSHPSQATE